MKRLRGGAVDRPTDRPSYKDVDARMFMRAKRNEVGRKGLNERKEGKLKGKEWKERRRKVERCSRCWIIKCY